MDLLNHICTVLQVVKVLGPDVNINKTQSRAITARVESLEPHLRALEASLARKGQGTQTEALTKQLTALLRTVESIQSLLFSFKKSSFGGFFSKLGNHAKEFARLNADLDRCQSDLKFGLAVESHVAAKQREDDARADEQDLAARHQELTRGMGQLQDGFAQVQQGQVEQSAALDRMQQSQTVGLAQLSRQVSQLQACGSGASAHQSDTIVPALTINFANLCIDADASPVSSNGFSTVHRAKLGKDQVAVKKLRVTELSEEELADFERAVQLLRVIPHHEHILSLKGAYIDPKSGSRLLVTDWMPNGSLRAYLKSTPALSLAERLELCQQCAQAIEHLHRLDPPLVHRNIKAGSFLLGRYKEIKLILGVEISGLGSSSAPLWSSNSRRLLPSTAPELVRDPFAQYTTACDVFSLGVVMWEILTGQVSDEGTDSSRVIALVKEGPAKLPSGETVPHDLIAELKKALREEPNKRPTIDSLCETIEEINEEIIRQPSTRAPDTNIAVATSTVPKQSAPPSAQVVPPPNTTPSTPAVLTTQSAEQDRTPAQGSLRALEVALTLAQKVAPSSPVVVPTQPLLVAAHRSDDRANPLGHAVGSKHHSPLHLHPTTRAPDASTAVVTPVTPATVLEQSTPSQQVAPAPAQQENQSQPSTDSFTSEEKSERATQSLTAEEPLQRGRALLNQLRVAAVEQNRKEAEQGHAEAQYILACFYSVGQGVAQSDSTAVKWLLKAAEQGHAKAQNTLGAHYGVGTGVGQSYTDSAKWYRAAAEQGLADAQFNLAVCYECGLGVAQSHKAEVEWLRKAAEQGYGIAQNNLGMCYLHGTGVSRSGSTAVEWFRKAAGQGIGAAHFNLGFCYLYGRGVSRSFPEVIKWYRSGAELGNPQASFTLGHYYKHGYGVPKSRATAVELFHKAAEKGHAEAQFKLGEYYRDGKDVAKSRDTAVKWFRLAAAQNHAHAVDSLANLQGRSWIHRWAVATGSFLLGRY